MAGLTDPATPVDGTTGLDPPERPLRLPPDTRPSPYRCRPASGPGRRRQGRRDGQRRQSLPEHPPNRSHAAVRQASPARRSPAPGCPGYALASAVAPSCSPMRAVVALRALDAALPPGLPRSICVRRSSSRIWLLTCDRGIGDAGRSSPQERPPPRPGRQHSGRQRADRTGRCRERAARRRPPPADRCAGRRRRSAVSAGLANTSVNVSWWIPAVSRPARARRRPGVALVRQAWLGRPAPTPAAPAPTPASVGVRAGRPRALVSASRRSSPGSQHPGRRLLRRQVGRVAERDLIPVPTTSCSPRTCCRRGLGEPPIPSIEVFDGAFAKRRRASTPARPLVRRSCRSLAVLRRAARCGG